MKIKFIKQCAWNSDWALRHGRLQLDAHRNYTIDSACLSSVNRVYPWLILIDFAISCYLKKCPVKFVNILSTSLLWNTWKIISLIFLSWYLLGDCERSQVRAWSRRLISCLSLFSITIGISRDIDSRYCSSCSIVKSTAASITVSAYCRVAYSKAYVPRQQTRWPCCCRCRCACSYVSLLSRGLPMSSSNAYLSC